MKVDALLLAAGGSSRLGRAKQCLEFAGQSLLYRAAHTLLDSHVHRVIAVLGANAEVCKEILDPLPVERVFNPRWKDGLSGSIIRGLRAAFQEDPDLEAVVIALCDQPLMTSALINEFIALHRQSQHDKIASVYGEIRGVPALFGKAHFEELLALEGQDGARTLLKRDDTLTVPFQAGSIDIDTPEQYRDLLSLKPASP